jgi:hypothetical protein
MDELEIDGKTYLSSKEAAKRTGYAKDYVGQLCREGRVEARLVGRSWYVFEPSIMKHRFSEETPAIEEGPVEVATTAEIVEESEKPNEQAVWEAPRYTPEEVPTIEIPGSKEENHVAVMEDAWKEWFSRDQEELKPQETYIEPKVAREVIEETTPTEEAPVPLNIVKAYKQEPAVDPIMPRVRPLEPAYNYSTTQARVEVARPAAQAIEPRNSFAVLKAFIVGIIFLVVSITAIATGTLSEKLGGAAGYGLLDLISGETKI